MKLLIDKYWKLFQTDGNNAVVEDSIPILWFGNLDAYFRSKHKVVTAALNPSFIEFYEKQSGAKGKDVRFQDAASLPNGEWDDSHYNTYVQAMNNYFCFNPYNRWFGHLESVLNCFDSSYYCMKADLSNTAVHIDIHAPVATNPTWGKISKKEKDQITGRYHECFEDMMTFLNPEVLIVSAAQDVICKKFGATKENCIAPQFQKGKAYIRFYYLDNDFKVSTNETSRLLVWGHNFRGNPFGGISNDDKKAYLGKVKDLILNNKI